MDGIKKMYVPKEAREEFFKACGHNLVIYKHEDETVKQCTCFDRSSDEEDEEDSDHQPESCNCNECLLFEGVKNQLQSHKIRSADVIRQRLRERLEWKKTIQNLITQEQKLKTMQPANQPKELTKEEKIELSFENNLIKLEFLDDDLFEIGTGIKQTTNQINQLKESNGKKKEQKLADAYEKMRNLKKRQKELEKKVKETVEVIKGLKPNIDLMVELELLPAVMAVLVPPPPKKEVKTAKKKEKEVNKVQDQEVKSKSKEIKKTSEVKNTPEVPAKTDDSAALCEVTGQQKLSEKTRQASGDPQQSSGIQKQSTKSFVAAPPVLKTASKASETAVAQQTPPATGVIPATSQASKAACQAPPAASGQAPPAASRQAPPAASRQAPPAASRQAPPAASRQAPPAASRQASPAASGQAPPAASRQAPPTASRQAPPAASRQAPPAASQVPEVFPGQFPMIQQQLSPGSIQPTPIIYQVPFYAPSSPLTFPQAQNQAGAVNPLFHLQQYTPTQTPHAVIPSHAQHPIPLTTATPFYPHGQYQLSPPAFKPAPTLEPFETFVMPKIPTIAKNSDGFYVVIDL